MTSPFAWFHERGALKKALRWIATVPRTAWMLRFSLDAEHPNYLSFTATHEGCTVVLAKQLVVDPFNLGGQETDEYRFYKSDMTLPGHRYEAAMIRDAYNALVATLHMEVETFVREERRKWRESQQQEPPRETESPPA
jgi:hypothetical protein